MANRVHLSERLQDAEGVYYSPLSRYMVQTFDRQPVFICISPCAPFVISVFDTTDVEDTQILGAVANVRSILLSFVRNNTVGDLTPAQRTAIDTWLTNRGYDTSWVVLATPLIQLIRSVVDSVRIAECCSVETGTIYSFPEFHSRLRIFGNLTAAQQIGILNRLAGWGYSGQVLAAETLEQICDKVRDRLASQ